MIPAFIGLYQVLLRMSNIESGSTTVGMLNASDVSAFRETTFYGAPLTDFAREHGDLINPILIAAIAFTMANSVISSCAVSAPLNLIRRSTAASSYSWAFAVGNPFLPVAPSPNRTYPSSNHSLLGLRLSLHVDPNRYL